MVGGDSESVGRDESFGDSIFSSSGEIEGKVDDPSVSELSTVGKGVSKLDVEEGSVAGIVLGGEEVCEETLVDAVCRCDEGDCDETGRVGADNR